MNHCSRLSYESPVLNKHQPVPRGVAREDAHGEAANAGAVLHAVLHTWRQGVQGGRRRRFRRVGADGRRPRRPRAVHQRTLLQVRWSGLRRVWQQWRGPRLFMRRGHRVRREVPDVGEESAVRLSPTWVFSPELVVRQSIYQRRLVGEHTCFLQ